MDRATFEALARADDVPGQLGAEEVKILILCRRHARARSSTSSTRNASATTTTSPSRRWRSGLERRVQRPHLFRDDRSNLAGTIIANDRFEPAPGERGRYALEFWPTDPVRARHIALAFDLVAEAMPFAAGKLAYHPAGDTQEALYAQDAGALRDAGVRTILTSELFRRCALRRAQPGRGVRRAVGRRPGNGAAADHPRRRALHDAAQRPRPRRRRDQRHAPTPLSHINLKAKQNDTPNAYIRDAATDPRLTPLLGQIVRYAVKPDDFELEAATAEQVEAWLERIRPTYPQSPPRDLTVVEITDLDELGHSRRPSSFGAKAANVGELRRVLPRGMVPDGYAIPFARYDHFMTEGASTTRAQKIIDDPVLRTDAVKRTRRSTTLRKRIQQADDPPEVAAAVAELQRASGRARASAAVPRRTTRTSRASTVPACTTPTPTEPTRAT